jgi:predicted nucleotidyltransferase
LAVFGSVVRDDFDPCTSDVDVITRIEAPSCTDYAERYFAIKEGLERMTGRTVDLLTEAAVTNPYLRQRIDAEKVTLFAA